MTALALKPRDATETELEVAAKRSRLLSRSANRSARSRRRPRNRPAPERAAEPAPAPAGAAQRPAGDGWRAAAACVDGSWLGGGQPLAAPRPVSSKGRRQKAEGRGRNRSAYENASDVIDSRFGFVLLPFDFCLLPSLSAQDRPTFRANSELVVLHVSVRDSGGRYVTGLSKDAFTVIDDAKPQTIEMFSADEVPATVGFLIDNSNSMRPSRERVVASAVAFAKHSHPEDEISPSTFNEAVQEAWHPTFVSDINPAQFASAMSAAIVARGMTAIYDGISPGSRASSAQGTRARC